MWLVWQERALKKLYFEFFAHPVSQKMAELFNFDSLSVKMVKITSKRFLLNISQTVKDTKILKGSKIVQN